MKPEQEIKLTTEANGEITIHIQSHESFQGINFYIYFFKDGKPVGYRQVWIPKTPPK